MITIKHIQKHLPLILVLAAFITVIVIIVTRPKEKVPVIQKEKIWPVYIQTIKITDAAPNVLLYGNIETPRHTTLKSAITAYVKATPVLEGEKVNAGQLIVALDNLEAKINLRQYEAEIDDLQAQIDTESNRFEFDKRTLAHEEILLEFNKKSVDRMQYLVKRKLAPQANLEQARSKLEQQQIVIDNRQQSINDHKNRLAQLQARLVKATALHDRAKLDLERTKITAPFSGRLSRLLVSLGDRVEKGDGLAQLYDTSRLEVRAKIPNKYIPSIHQALTNNQPITAKASVHGREITLKLNRISGLVTKDGSATGGIFSVPQTINDLPLGLSLQLQVILPKIHQVAIVPIQALYDNDTIYEVIKQHMVAVNVSVMGSSVSSDHKEYALVSSPELKTGDVIVVSHMNNATSGLKVQVIKK